MIEEVKQYSEKGYHFIFENREDKYFCLKAFVLVEMLKRKIKKISDTHTVFE